MRTTGGRTFLWTMGALLVIAAAMLVVGVGAAALWIAAIAVGIAAVVIVQRRARHGLHSQAR